MNWWFSELFTDVALVKPALDFYGTNKFSYSYQMDDEVIYAKEEELDFIKSLPLDFWSHENDEIPQEYNGDIYSWYALDIKRFLINTKLLESGQDSQDDKTLTLTNYGNQLLNRDEAIEEINLLSIIQNKDLQYSHMMMLFKSTIQMLNLKKFYDFPFKGVLLLEAAILFIGLFEKKKQAPNTIIMTISRIITSEISPEIKKEIETEYEALSNSIDNMTHGKILKSIILYRVYFYKKYMHGHKEKWFNAFIYSDFLWESISKLIGPDLSKTLYFITKYRVNTTLQFYIRSGTYKFGRVPNQAFGLIQTFDVIEFSELYG